MSRCFPCASGLCPDTAPCKCARMPPLDQAPGSGCWLAQHADWSGFAIFREEIDALRYSNDNYMTVRFVEWGVLR